MFPSRLCELSWTFSVPRSWGMIELVRMRWPSWLLDALRSSTLDAARPSENRALPSTSWPGLPLLEGGKWCEGCAGHFSCLLTKYSVEESVPTASDICFPR